MDIVVDVLNKLAEKQMVMGNDELSYKLAETAFNMEKKFTCASNNCKKKIVASDAKMFEEKAFCSDHCIDTYQVNRKSDFEYILEKYSCGGSCGCGHVVDEDTEANREGQDWKEKQKKKKEQKEKTDKSKEKKFDPKRRKNWIERESTLNILIAKYAGDGFFGKPEFTQDKELPGEMEDPDEREEILREDSDAFHKEPCDLDHQEMKFKTKEHSHDEKEKIVKKHKNFTMIIEK